MNADQKKFTVTVGIPAYNEEANIANLVRSIMEQRQTLFTLEKIIITNDGSTDATEKIVSSLADAHPFIFFMTDGQRKGKAERLNQIYRANPSELLFTIDADVQLGTNDIINQMAAHFEDRRTALVAANVQPLQGTTIAEKIAVAGETLWYEARKNYKDGNNIYNISGQCSAMRDSFAKSFQYPRNVVADQQVAYLNAIQQNKMFKFAKNTVVYFRAPATFHDIFVKTSRSLTEKNQIVQIFGSTVQGEYFIPYGRKIAAIFRALFQNPLWTVLAIIFQIILRIIPLYRDNLHERGLWKTTLSSKNISEAKKITFKKEMLFAIKRIALQIFYVIGKLFGADRRTLSVLCYHSLSNAGYRYAVSLPQIQKQMEKIASLSSFVSVDDAVSVIDGKPIKRPAIVVTIDDSYADAIDFLPIAKQYRIPVALFILSDPENTNRRELGHTGDLLSWEQIKMLRTEGWTIGCHSATHADFRHLTDEQLRQEITQSKKIIEEKISGTVEHFAYPKGVFDDRIIAAVKRAGYKAGWSIEPGCVTVKSDRWKLPRTIIDQTHEASEFPVVYSPTSFFIRKMTNRFHLWDKFLKYES